MSLKRRFAAGTAFIVALWIGVQCWQVATRIHTVIITVPDADGFFAVWVRDAHPDVVEVEDGVATFTVPEEGLLRARSMACLEDWHTERYVDRRGQAVEDVHGLSTAFSSRWDGKIKWWYRGAKCDRMYSSEAKAAWLSDKGVER